MSLTPLSQSICSCLPSSLCETIDGSEYGNKNGVPEMEDLPNDPKALQRLVGTGGLECLPSQKSPQKTAILRAVGFGAGGALLGGFIGSHINRRPPVARFPEHALAGLVMLAEDGAHLFSQGLKVVLGAAVGGIAGLVVAYYMLSE